MSDETVDPQLDKKKGREILQLKAKEVSMVDRPAILREFLVIKRQTTEDNMGAFESEERTDTKIEDILKGLADDPNVEWLDIDAEKAALTDDTKKAFTGTTEFLAKVAAGTDEYPSPKSKDKSDVKKELPADLKSAIQRVIQFLGKVAGGKYPYPKPAAMSKQGKPEDEMDEEKKKKAKEEAERKAKEEADKKEEEAKKSASEGLSVKITPDGGVEITGTPVSKAGKSQFTTDRTSELKGAVQKLLTMLATVDKDAAKGLIEELVKSVLPADLKWTPGTTATDAAAVRKQMEEVVAPVLKQLSDLGGKVETIEKSRPAPKSEQGDGDQTNVEKRDSVWDGLPLPR